MAAPCFSKEFGFPCDQCDGPRLIPPGAHEMDDYECLLGDKCPLEPCKKSQLSNPGYMDLSKEWFKQPKHGAGRKSYRVSLASLERRRERERERKREIFEQIYSNRDFPAPERVLLELKVSRGGKYVCPYCGLLYDEEETGKEHISHSHGQQFCFKCTVENCGQTSKRYGYYVRHVIKHHRAHYKSEVFTCDICNSEYTTMRCLYEHKLYHHRADRRVPCPKCGIELLQRSMLLHIRRRHQTAAKWKYVCRHAGCEEKFSDIGSTIYHEKSVHNMW